MVEIMAEEDFTDVQVPTRLFKRAAEKIKGTKFESVSRYVSFILEEALLSEGAMKEQTFSKDDEEAVKERLRALGYLG
jgi:predicted nucleotidyltransferase